MLFLCCSVELLLFFSSCMISELIPHSSEVLLRHPIQYASSPLFFHLLSWSSTSFFAPFHASKPPDVERDAEEVIAVTELAPYLYTAQFAPWSPPHQERKGEHSTYERGEYTLPPGHPSGTGAIVFVAATSAIVREEGCRAQPPLVVHPQR